MIPAAVIAIAIASLSPLCCGHPQAAGTNPATTTTSIAWGPLHMGGPCPIIYPFSNETSFCSSVGRQRAIVQVDASAGAGSGAAGAAPTVACATLPWRRRDDPSNMGVFVMRDNVTFVPARLNAGATQMNGTVCFEHAAAGSSATAYAIYFMPFAWYVLCSCGVVASAWHDTWYSTFSVDWSGVVWSGVVWCGVAWRCSYGVAVTHTHTH